MIAVIRNAEHDDCWVETGIVRPGGTGYIAWSDLEDALRYTGFVRADERVMQFRADANGLAYVVEKEA